MQRLRRFISLLMAGIWMLSVLHCNLEAAELIPAEPAHSGVCCENRSRCTHDGCEQVENAPIKPWSDGIKVASPDLVTCACLICLQETAPLLATAIEVRGSDFDRPLNWIPSWQFTHRAAPPARAPSLVS